MLIIITNEKRTFFSGYTSTVATVNKVDQQDTNKRTKRHLEIFFSSCVSAKMYG